MIYILLWISGAITTVSLTLAGRFYLLHQKGKGEMNLILPDYKRLLAEKKEKESLKRLAKFRTTGWHLVSESNNPKKKTWDVVFELREIAVSQDESKSKFEVISVISEGDIDSWNKEDYEKWFLKKTGGGWISTDNSNLEWITTMSKTEARDLKLKDLGI